MLSECLKPAIVTKYVETWNCTLWVGYNVHVSVKKLNPILEIFIFVYCTLRTVECLNHHLTNCVWWDKKERCDMFYFVRIFFWGNMTF